MLDIRNCADTDFVSIILERDFYEGFKKASSELGVSTRFSMLKTLEDYHEKMRRALNRANTKPDCGRRGSIRTEHGLIIRTGCGNKE